MRASHHVKRTGGGGRRASHVPARVDAPREAVGRPLRQQRQLGEGPVLPKKRPSLRDPCATAINNAGDIAGISGVFGYVLRAQVLQNAVLEHEGVRLHGGWGDIQCLAVTNDLPAVVDRQRNGLPWRATGQRSDLNHAITGPHAGRAAREATHKADVSAAVDVYRRTSRRARRLAEIDRRILRVNRAAPANGGCDQGGRKRDAGWLSSVPPGEGLSCHSYEGRARQSLAAEYQVEVSRDSSVPRSICQPILLVRLAERVNIRSLLYGRPHIPANLPSCGWPD